MSVKRPGSPLEHSAQTPRLDSPSPEAAASPLDLAPIVAERLPQFGPYGPFQGLTPHQDLPLVVSHYFSSLQDIHHYLAAFHFPEFISRTIGNQIASPALIVNTFRNYCTHHPESFLAGVCRPAMDRLLEAHPAMTPIDALNQVCADYFDSLPLPELRNRNVKTHFQELETRYQTTLHPSYALFFRSLLLVARLPEPDDRPLYQALNEEGPTYHGTDEAHYRFTPEDIIRIIAKCHQPEYRTILGRIKGLHLNNNNPPGVPQLESLLLLPPEFRLLTGLRRLELTNTRLPKSINLSHASELRLFAVFSAFNRHLVTTLDLRHNHLLSQLYVNGYPFTDIYVSQQLPPNATLRVHEDTRLQRV